MGGSPESGSEFKSTRVGVHPYQFVFGRDPDIPTSLLRSPESVTAQSAAVFDERARRSEDIRRAAEVATAEADADEKLRRAFLKKSRPARGPWEVGQMVFFWRDQGSPGRGLMKNLTGWRGPAVILAVESDSRIFISYNGTPVLCAPEQLRAASADEVAMGHLLEEVRDTRTRLDIGETQMGFVDARGAGPAGSSSSSSGGAQAGPAGSSSEGASGGAQAEATPAGTAAGPQVFDIAPGDDEDDAMGRTVPEPQTPGPRATPEPAAEASPEQPQQVTEVKSEIPPSMPTPPMPRPSTGDLPPIPSDDEDGLVARRLWYSFMAKREQKVVQRKMAVKNTRELKVDKLPAAQQAKFEKALYKEWASWIKHGAVRLLTEEELKQVQESRVLRMRRVDTDKNGANRGDRSYEDLELEAKTRLVVPGFADPDALEGRIRTDAPTAPPRGGGACDTDGCVVQLGSPHRRR